MRNFWVKAAPFVIVLLAAVFVYNIYTHGRIEHPGKTTYRNLCANCHGDNGEGTIRLIPPLRDADFARTYFDSIPCWIKNGMNRKIVVNGIEYDQMMYGVKISDVEAANVINYISKEFLQSNRTVNAYWVNTQWQQCK